jgi:hypothetical protein
MALSRFHWTLHVGRTEHILPSRSSRGLCHVGSCSCPYRKPAESVRRNIGNMNMVPANTAPPDPNSKRFFLLKFPYTPMFSAPSVRRPSSADSPAFLLAPLFCGSAAAHASKSCPRKAVWPAEEEPVAAKFQQTYPGRAGWLGR